MANHRHHIYPENIAIGGRVRLARLEAGYISQVEALPALGLSRSMVIAHENGYHRISPLRLKRYAEVYGVSTAWLKTGIAPEGEPAPSEPTEGWNYRLILARRVAGFVRKADVMKRYGVYGAHLCAHEAGEGLLRRDQAEMYAKAYSVSADWLRFGIHPSGLPEKIVGQLDRYLATFNQADDRARTFLPVVDPTRAGPVDEVVALLPRLLPVGPRSRREVAVQDPLAKRRKTGAHNANEPTCQDPAATQGLTDDDLAGHSEGAEGDVQIVPARV